MKYLKETHTHETWARTQTRAHTHTQTQTHTRGSSEKGHEHRKSVTSDDGPKCLPVQVNG